MPYPANVHRWIEVGVCARDIQHCSDCLSAHWMMLVIWPLFAELEKVKKNQKNKLTGGRVLPSRKTTNAARITTSISSASICADTIRRRRPKKWAKRGAKGAKHGGAFSPSQVSTFPYTISKFVWKSPHLILRK